jgi:hypothetical protein
MTLRLVPSLLLTACSVAFAPPPDAERLAGRVDSAGGDSAVSGAGGAVPDDSATGETGVDPAPADGAGAEPAPEPCTAYGETRQTGVIHDAALDEISGVAASRRNPGVLWVMEDHAGPNEVTAIDDAGNELGRLVLLGVENHDWEDVAVGTCGATTCLFVGDIGDNDHDRTWHGVLRVEEPEVSLTGGFSAELTPEVFPYVFPDGGHWDSEALAVQPDGLPVLFTKEYDTEHATAYAFPVLDSTQTVTLTERSRFETGAPGEGGVAATTAADLWPDGSRLIVRTYGHIWEFTLTELGLDELEEAARAELYTGSERQGEAIGYDPFIRGYYTLSEDVNPPIFRTECGDAD